MLSAPVVLLVMTEYLLAGDIACGLNSFEVLHVREANPTRTLRETLAVGGVSDVVNTRSNLEVSITCNNTSAIHQHIRLGGPWNYSTPLTLELYSPDNNRRGKGRNTSQDGRVKVWRPRKKTNNGI